MIEGVVVCLFATSESPSTTRSTRFIWVARSMNVCSGLETLRPRWMTTWDPRLLS